GVDLVEIAVHQALGEEVPDELVSPRFQQPVAIRFLTAEPGPLPTGVVQAVGPLDKARAFPGVERVDAWLAVGETIRPVQTDVDLSLEAALVLAELEQERGAQATYFLMTESVFYNLDSQLGRETLGRLRELGHAVGLHAVHPRARSDARFDPVLAWHNPDPEF